jgi:hypothetical protein
MHGADSFDWSSHNRAARILHEERTANARHSSVFGLCAFWGMVPMAASGKLQEIANKTILLRKAV